MLNRFDGLGGHTAHNGVGWNVFRHYCSGSDHRVLADSHSRQDGGIGANPHIALQHHSSGNRIASVFWGDTMIEGRDDDVVPNLAAVADDEPTLILKSTTGVDKHTFAKGGVLTAIRGEWREQREAFRHLLTGEFAHKLAKFRLGVIAAIDFGSDLLGLIRQSNHDQMHVGTASYGVAGIHIGEEFAGGDTWLFTHGD